MLTHIVAPSRWQRHSSGALSASGDIAPLLEMDHGAKVEITDSNRLIIVTLGDILKLESGQEKLWTVSQC